MDGKYIIRVGAYSLGHCVLSGDQTSTQIHQIFQSLFKYELIDKFQFEKIISILLDPLGAS